MDKFKVEAIRVQLGMKQSDFIDGINNVLSDTLRSDKHLSLRTYQNRLSGKVKWGIDEATAISKMSGIPMDKISF